MVELNRGWPNTNPSSGREEDFNPQPPDYTSGTLTTKHDFPCSAPVTCLYFEISLIASRNCLCPLWLTLVITLVLVEQHSIKKHFLSIFTQHHHRSYQLLFDRSWWPGRASMRCKGWWCGGHGTTAVWSTPLKTYKQLTYIYHTLPYSVHSTYF